MYFCGFTVSLMLSFYFVLHQFFARVIFQWQKVISILNMKMVHLWCCSYVYDSWFMPYAMHIYSSNN